MNKNCKGVYTQEELDQAIEDGYIPICYGDGEFTVTGSAQVRATGSAQVTANGNAQVTAYESAQVTAYDSAQVRAYGSAQVRAYDSAQVRAYDSAQVRATPYVAVTIDPGHTGKITGGVQVKIPTIKTTVEWFDFYGVEVKDGVATLYKAVDDDFSTENARKVGITYRPGDMPVAPDWDGGKEECGGGLHFSPSPAHALEFNPGAARFVACPVRVDEIVVHYPAHYPDKVKAPRVCAPCYEVDITGKAIQGSENV